MEISRVWRTPNMISWDMNWQPFDLWMSEHGDFSPQVMVFWRNPSGEPSNHNRESTMILMAQKKPLPPQHFVLEHLLQTHTLMFFGTPSLCSTLIQHLVSFFFLLDPWFHPQRLPASGWRADAFNIPWQTLGTTVVHWGDRYGAFCRGKIIELRDFPLPWFMTRGGSPPPTVSRLYPWLQLD